MKYNVQLKELSRNVNIGLSIYISVHNRIQKESSSFWSTVKNIFGKGVPMAELHEHSKELIPVWNSIQTEIDNFKSRNYSSLSDDEKYYFDLLSNYTEALQKTISLLIEKQRVMAEGSKNISAGTSSWSAIKETQQEYKLAIDEYLVIGQQLNDAARIIF